MKPILMLAGPEGGGKTTLARELAATAAGPVAYFEGDKF